MKFPNEGLDSIDNSAVFNLDFASCSVILNKFEIPTCVEFKKARLLCKPRLLMLLDCNISNISVVVHISLEQILVTTLYQNSKAW